MPLLTLLIYLLVLVIIFALVWWVLQQVALPEPIGRFVRIIAVVIFALILIVLLLNVAGVGPNLQLR